MKYVVQAGLEMVKISVYKIVFTIDLHSISVNTS